MYQLQTGKHDFENPPHEKTFDKADAIVEPTETNVSINIWYTFYRIILIFKTKTVFFQRYEAKKFFEVHL